MAFKLGYQLYSIRHPTESDARLFMPGLFSWVTAFEQFGREAIMSANIKKESLENYDIIHVNYTPTNETYITALRNELGNSDTKIVANVDFGKAMWNTIDPLIMKDQLNRADMVFHVESNGAKSLERLLGRKVYTIPHPTNVEGIKKWTQMQEDLNKRERHNMITCQYHRYADTWTDYYMGLEQIRKENDVEIVLMNYEAPSGMEGPKVPIICMFSRLYQRMPYKVYMENYLQRALINVDVTYDYTFGRGVVDAAALKIPTVGSSTIEAARKFWPELLVTTGKEWEIEEKVNKLLGNNDLWCDMADQGFERCDEYGLEASYNKMVAALETEGLI
jgi:hypothetical protein